MSEELVEKRQLSGQEEAYLARLIGATLVGVETSLCYGISQDPEYTESDLNDYCLLWVRDTKGEFFLTIRNTLEDVLGYWDVPKPEIGFLEQRPSRPLTKRIGKHQFGGKTVWADTPIAYKRFDYGVAVLAVEVWTQTMSDPSNGFTVFDDFAIQLALEGGGRVLFYTDCSILETIKMSDSEVGIHWLLNGPSAHSGVVEVRQLGPSR